MMMITRKVGDAVHARLALLLASQLMRRASKSLDLSWRQIYRIIIISVMIAILDGIFTARPLIDISMILPGGVTLSKFLIPRTPGSPGHITIQNYVERHFKRLGWHFEVDRFSQNTINNQTITFTNLIATNNIKAKNRIVFGAHYDSKAIKGVNFIGATDSAWSCSLLLELSRCVRKRDDVAIQMIFFDGEESFGEWNADDSLYGSRHLSRYWESLGKLQGIRYMILLDLLGAKNPKIYSFFPETDYIFKRFKIIEESLRKHNILRTKESIFMEDKRFHEAAIEGVYVVEDDHMPFHRLGVPVLQIIPLPFPEVWHKPEDDIRALDLDTCHDLALIMHTFIQNIPL